MSSPAARLLPVVAAGAVALAAAIVVAVASGTGYVGAVAGVLVVLVAADLAYAWRTNRRRAAVDARTATALRRAAEASEARHAELRAALERVETGQGELRQALAGLAETAEIAVVEIRLLRVSSTIPR